MANAITHQRNIIEIQKPVEVILFFGTNFCCMATVPGHDVILFCAAGEAGYGAVSGNFKFSEGGRGRYEIRLWGSMYFSHPPRNEARNRFKEPRNRVAHCSF
jgi:hypothetical protein